jgi:hypothetical protein
MKAQILKQLVSLGKTLEVGDIADVSSWKNIKALENNRYIKIIHEDSKPVKAKAEPVEAAKPKKTTKKETAEE